MAGDQLLVISGTAQAKIYDRDGEEKYATCFLLAVFRPYGVLLTYFLIKTNVHQGRSIHSRHEKHRVRPLLFLN